LKSAEKDVYFSERFKELAVRKVVFLSFAALTLLLVYGEVAFARVGSGGPL
jgi:hypothetical protein